MVKQEYKQLDIKKQASAIELNIYRERWLMVKSQLSDLNHYEQQAVIDRIKEKSKRVTEHQLLKVHALCESGDFLTIVPQD